MKSFKFRAQPALDLRTRELQAAQRELARAEQVRDVARHRLQEADLALVGARMQAAEAQCKAGSIAGLEWYRFWIVRLDHERAALAATLAARDQDVATATASCIRAQQRHDSLDRFKDKARTAYDAAEHAAETKLIDELATRRFTAARHA